MNNKKNMKKGIDVKDKRKSFQIENHGRVGFVNYAQRKRKKIVKINDDGRVGIVDYVCWPVFVPPPLHTRSPL